jgi:hypothetical protein
MHGTYVVRHLSTQLCFLLSKLLLDMKYDPTDRLM